MSGSGDPFQQQQTPNFQSPLPSPPEYVSPYEVLLGMPPGNEQIANVARPDPRSAAPGRAVPGSAAAGRAAPGRAVFRAAADGRGGAAGGRRACGLQRPARALVPRPAVPGGLGRRRPCLPGRQDALPGARAGNVHPAWKELTLARWRTGECKIALTGDPDETTDHHMTCEECRAAPGRSTRGRTRPTTWMPSGAT